MIQVQEITFNLYDFFKTVKKHWKMVLSITAISTVISISTMGIKFFSTPKLYAITMFIEPGTISGANGKKIPLDSANEIDERIKNKVYRWKLKGELIKPFAGVNLNFDVLNPEETDLVKIVSIQEKNNAANGIKLMNALFVEFYNDNEEKIKIRKMQLKERLDDINETIAAKNNMIELQKENVITLNKRKKSLRSSRKRYNAALPEKEKVCLDDNKKTEKEIKDLNSQKSKVSLAEADIRNIALFREPKAERVIVNQKLWFYPIGGAIMGFVIGSSLACIIELRKKYNDKV